MHYSVSDFLWLYIVYPRFTQFNERTKHFFIKISLILFSFSFVVSLRDRWRDIYSERTSSHIFFREQRVPKLASLCKLVRDDLIGYVSHARHRFSALCLNLTAWFSSRGLLPVTNLLYPMRPDVLSYPCLLITAWQLVKAHGVTRNE